MKPFTSVAVLMLALIALLQLIRFVLGWPVVINTIAVPLWFSAAAFVVLAGLAAMVWREHKG